MTVVVSIQFWPTRRSCLPPSRGIQPSLLGIPAPIPPSGIGAGIGTARFSLSHRHCPAGLASQPHAPNKLCTWGWEVKQWRWDREAMLAWLGVVKVADIDAIRWALAGLQDGAADTPVSYRRANQWIARLAEIGVIDRFRPIYKDRQIVWATRRASGQIPPSLFRQTLRHELAVATVSARYIARGFTWQRDRKPLSFHEHQADGVAIKGDVTELIEVELTAKNRGRYKPICASHSARMANEGVTRVVYLCVPAAARAVSREADKFIFRTERHRLVALPVFDGQGKWVGNDTDLWVDAPTPVEGVNPGPRVELWDRSAV
jgi:hypothetical protein